MACLPCLLLNPHTRRNPVVPSWYVEYYVGINRHQTGRFADNLEAVDEAEKLRARGYGSVTVQMSMLPPQYEARRHTRRNPRDPAMSFRVLIYAGGNKTPTVEYGLGPKWWKDAAHAWLERHEWDRLVLQERVGATDKWEDVAELQGDAAIRKIRGNPVSREQALAAIARQRNEAARARSAGHVNLATFYEKRVKQLAKSVGSNPRDYSSRAKIEDRCLDLAQAYRQYTGKSGCVKPAVKDWLHTETVGLLKDARHAVLPMANPGGTYHVIFFGAPTTGTPGPSTIVKEYSGTKAAVQREARLFAKQQDLRLVAIRTGPEPRVNPYRTSRFRHEDAEYDLSRVDPRSIRSIYVGKHGKMLRIGCPKGYFNAKTKHCRKGTKAVAWLTPVRSQLNPPVTMRAVREAAAEYQRLMQLYGENNMATQRAEFKYRELQAAYDRTHGKRSQLNPRARTMSTALRKAEDELRAYEWKLMLLPPRQHATLAQHRRRRQLLARVQALRRSTGRNRELQDAYDRTHGKRSNPMKRFLGVVTRRLPTRLRRQVEEAIGGIQAQDIGKRIYDVGGVIQVENNQQRDARLRTGRNPELLIINPRRGHMKRCKCVRRKHGRRRVSGYAAFIRSQWRAHRAAFKRLPFKTVSKRLALAWRKKH